MIPGWIVPKVSDAGRGLWNPEWTSHGPFFEKIKDRLVRHNGVTGKAA
jgi:hypothetical protein